MAKYTPTNWKNGDLITAARLNKIEIAISTLSESGGTPSWGTSVTSFNGRTGAVAPQAGDYTVSQITGAASSSELNALGTIVDGLSNRTDANEQAIADLQDAIGDGVGADVTTIVDNKIATAIGALDKSDAEVAGQFVSEVSQTDGIISVKRVALPDYSNVYDAKGAADSALQSAKDYADMKDSAIQSVQTKADNVANAVNELSDYVGDIPAQSVAQTIIEYIDEKLSSAYYDDTELKKRVFATESAIDTLNGTGVGSVAKTVSDAIATIVADAPESLDTLKEISDWITNHSNTAAEMNSKINANSADIIALQNLIGQLPSTAEATNIVDYINEVVATVLDDVVGNIATTLDAINGEVI